MREILYRGQTRRFGEKIKVGTGEKLPGKWVYGGIFPGSGDFSIIYGCSEQPMRGNNIEKYSVYSDTVCEFTGQTDSRDVFIFEGDTAVNEQNGARFVIEWDGEKSCFVAVQIGEEQACEQKFQLTRMIARQLTVVGNIFDENVAARS